MIVTHHAAEAKLLEVNIHITVTLTVNQTHSRQSPALNAGQLWVACTATAQLHLRPPPQQPPK